MEGDVLIGLEIIESNVFRSYLYDIVAESYCTVVQNGGLAPWRQCSSTYSMSVRSYRNHHIAINTPRFPVLG